ncbi:MAG TPA: FKBP-type peptidyl-prolyl cis-trans isomerase, partial [Anaerolineae bacterium]
NQTSATTGAAAAANPASAAAPVVPTAPAPAQNGPVQGAVTTQSGLQYVDEVVGTGAQPQKGQTVVVNYTGYLDNGTIFDSSVQRNQPFSFVLGTGQVIAGWDEGIATMKVGGKRKLIIPPSLGYGAQGQGSIPANAQLTFEVELLQVK